MQDEDLALMTHYQWLLPLLQNPALEKGLFYGLNWFNRHNPDFGRLSGEEVSGHWLRAHLRHDFESRKTVLCLANLNPEWDFPLTRIIIPASAFEWMKWKGEHVYFKEMGSDSPLTDPYTLDELSEDGFSVKIKAGEGMLFEISY